MYVSVHLPPAVPVFASVQVDVAKLPLLLGVVEKVTVPVGGDVVPVSVSVTVAVQVVAAETPTTIVVGVHVTTSVFARVVTLMTAAVAVLVAWAVSPP